MLRAGSAEKTFRGLADAGVLEPISEELHRGATDALWQSLRAVDAYRQKFTAAPETLTNPVLLGSFLVPLGLSPQLGRPAYVELSTGKRRPAIPKMGSLPLARRDVERLRQILGLQRRLRDLGGHRVRPSRNRCAGQRGSHQRHDVARRTGLPYRCAAPAARGRQGGGPAGLTLRTAEARVRASPGGSVARPARPRVREGPLLGWAR